MDLYHTFAGALVLGAMLLIGSGIVLAVTLIDRTLRSARSRTVARRHLRSVLGIALFAALCVGFGRVAFDSAFDTKKTYVPIPEVRWEPATVPAPTRFDRFDHGSASNAEFTRRG